MIYVGERAWEPLGRRAGKETAEEREAHLMRVENQVFLLSLFP